MLVVGCISTPTPSKDIYILISGTCECSLRWPKKTDTEREKEKERRKGKGFLEV